MLFSPPEELLFELTLRNNDALNFAKAYATVEPSISDYNWALQDWRCSENPILSTMEVSAILGIALGFACINQLNFEWGINDVSDTDCVLVLVHKEFELIEAPFQITSQFMQQDERDLEEVFATITRKSKGIFGKQPRGTTGVTDFNCAT